MSNELIKGNAKLGQAIFAEASEKENKRKQEKILEMVSFIIPFKRTISSFFK